MYEHFIAHSSSVLRSHLLHVTYTDNLASNNHTARTGMNLQQWKKKMYLHLLCHLYFVWQVKLQYEVYELNVVTITCIQITAVNFNIC